jgi:hypothetical protein
LYNVDIGCRYYVCKYVGVGRPVMCFLTSTYVSSVPSARVVQRELGSISSIGCLLVHIVFKKTDRRRKLHVEIKRSGTIGIL